MPVLVPMLSASVPVKVGVNEVGRPQGRLILHQRIDGAIIDQAVVLG